MRKKTMKLGDALRQIGDQSVYLSVPCGDQYVEQVTLLTGVELDVATATGTECLAAIGSLPTEQRTTLLDKEVDAVISGNDMQAAIELISTVRAGQSNWKTGVAVGMAILVAIVVINHCILLYLSTVHGLIAPRWQDSVYISILPGGIVWTWYGVLTKENRDIISAAVGEIPKSGPWGAVINAVLRRSPSDAPQPTPQPPQWQTPPNVPPVQQTPPPVVTGDLNAGDGPNDNPPPGAANLDNTNLSGFTASDVKR